MEKILVFTPTYNERGNVQKLYQALKKLPLELDILFCDDNSPDGTGKVIDDLVAKDSHVHVIHRPSKMGLGTATKAAFEYSRKHGYDYLLTMDADFTHDPSYIPAMVSQKDKGGIVVGSRYISGGKMEGWNKIRLPFTYFWRSLIKYGLDMPYDSTGAFRLYSVSVLDPKVCAHLQSNGFSFGLEALYRLKLNGAKVTEVPILARSRTEGKSKLSVKIMAEFAKQFLKLLCFQLFSRKKKVS